MKFDLSIFDWTAFGAVVTALMVVVTLYTVYQNRIQLKELKNSGKKKIGPEYIRV